MTPSQGTVSICIPAFEAAEFIERTLDCATAQTYANRRILVSIDRSEDRSEEICRAYAALAGGVEVHAQSQRLGWAGNVNFLLERARASEYAFLYFHDDLIDPDYCERLIGALEVRPDAASAHCAVGHFGASEEKVIPARSLEGPLTERLLDFLTVRNKPSVLRSMFRTEAAGHLRLPTGAAGVWANQPFQMALVGAGPAIGVPDVLYRRWHQREGGLTAGWRRMTFEEILAGYRANTEEALGLIHSLDVSPAERDLLAYGLMIHMTIQLRRAEKLHGAAAAHPPGALHPELAGLEPPPTLAQLPARLRRQCEETAEKVRRRTRNRERRVARA